jgi:NTE family protein
VSQQHKRAYLVFEGGGAKGVLHTATLRAVQAENLDVRGYAGTSAGAIFAALAAVGYKHDELIRLTRSEDRVVLSSAVMNLWVDGRAIRLATHFFKTWWLIRIFREILGRRWSAISFGFILLVVLLGPGFGFMPKLTLPLLIALLTFLAIYLLSLAGIATLGRMRRGLNLLMAQKLDLAAGEEVTFGALADRGKVLSVVTTNVTSGALRLFSTDNPEDCGISVAQAVAASASIPFLFRPVRIDGELYCDGGLVSNLPAWVFEADTVNDAEAWVIASNLVDDRLPSGTGRTRSGLPYIAGVFRAAVFGADMLSKRAVRNLFSVEVPAPIGLLEFDYHRFPNRFAAAYLNASIQTATQIKSYLAEAAAHAHVFGKLQDQIARRHTGLDVKGLRSALVRGGSAGGPHPVYHLWHCIGFADQADRYLSVSGKHSMISNCFADLDLRALDLGDPEDVKRFRRIDLDGLIWDRTPDDRAWSLALPLRVRDEDTSKTNKAKFVSVALTLDAPNGIPLPDQEDLRGFLEIIDREWHIGMVGLGRR